MLVTSLLRYCLNARDEHSLHSPFLFNLYTQTIRADNRHQPAFLAIEAQRRALKQSTARISVVDYGTGAGQYVRSVRSIARQSLKSAKYGRLLFRLVQRFQTRTVLDLGTSLGITTAYLAKATDPFGGQVITFEGCPETAKLAHETFTQLACPNIRQVVGNLNETLSPTLVELPPLDLVFFDANHQYEPTIQYFTACLDHIHNDSVFIFDDLYWSIGMEQAWNAIRQNPVVTITVDLFGVGLVFFRREQPKQDFILRF